MLAASTVLVGNTSGLQARTWPCAGAAWAPSFVTSAVQTPLYARARSIYASTIPRHVVRPDLIAAWRLSIVASSTWNGAAPSAADAAGPVAGGALPVHPYAASAAPIRPTRAPRRHDGALGARPAFIARLCAGSLLARLSTVGTQTAVCGDASPPRTRRQS